METEIEVGGVDRFQNMPKGRFNDHSFVNYCYNLCCIELNYLDEFKSTKSHSFRIWKGSESIFK